MIGRWLRREKLTRAALAKMMSVPRHEVYDMGLGMKSAQAQWWRTPFVLATQSLRRERGPKWMLAFDERNTSKPFMIHLHRPGLVLQGRKVIAWLDDPTQFSHAQLRMVLDSARIKLETILTERR